MYILHPIDAAWLRMENALIELKSAPKLHTITLCVVFDLVHNSRKNRKLARMFLQPPWRSIFTGKRAFDKAN